MSDNKRKSTKNGKKEDETFRSKNIKHNPQAESARAVFGKDGSRSDNDFSRPHNDAR